jgi:NAD-dependent deacetylase sirtuin 4
MFQEWLGQANPRWHAFLAELERTGAHPKTNPDGDVYSIDLFSFFLMSLVLLSFIQVALDASVSHDDFVVPHCPGCDLEGCGRPAE